MQSAMFMVTGWPWLLLTGALGVAFGWFFCREHQ